MFSHLRRNLEFRILKKISYYILLHFAYANLSWVKHTREELPVAFLVMQSFPNELSTPVAVKGICKQRKNNIYTIIFFAYWSF